MVRAATVRRGRSCCIQGVKRGMVEACAFLGPLHSGVQVDRHNTAGRIALKLHIVAAGKPDHIEGRFPTVVLPQDAVREARSGQRQIQGR